MVACKRGHDEIVKILLDNSNNLTKHRSHISHPPLWTAVNKGHKSIVKLLLEYKADPSAKYDNLARPCLHEALRLHQIGIAKMLLAARADPVAVDGQGNTPLHLAVASGKAEIVNLIINSMITIKNMEDKTPVDLVPSTSVDKEDILQQFIISNLQ